ncbi:MAG: 4-hydroxyphenylacetate 3-hydroxylase C-terminal domain-containing protein [Dehalococcoidia bacterium]
MITGNQYRESLRDGRKSFMEGALVSDPSSHPLMSVSVDWVARTYDRYHSAAAGAANPMFVMPSTTEQLQEQMDMLLVADPTASSTAGAMALRSVAGDLARLNPAYQVRLEGFLDGVRDNDRRIAVAQTDLGGLRVVSRTADGVVISGGKQHVVGGAVAHELFVVPSRHMGPDEGDSAIACAVPANAPGVKMVSTTTAPRAHDTRHFPYSRERSIPDSLVIFEDVFVPNDRIFLNGEVERSGELGETLGVWERARSTAVQADQAEILLGVANSIAEMNGVAEASHIRDKLATMAVYARMCRAGWEAALAHAKTNAAGMVIPDDSFVYATRAYGVTNYSEMAGWVHDIGGGLILTAPSIGDYENEATHMYVEKYMSTGSKVRGEHRLRMFHLIRDLTADTYAGWSKLNNQMIGGGLFAQKLSALDTYPMAVAEGKAQAAAHIDPQ